MATATMSARKLFTPAKYRLIQELQTPKRLAELSRQLKNLMNVLIGLGRVPEYSIK